MGILITEQKLDMIPSKFAKTDNESVSPLYRYHLKLAE